MKSNLVKIFVIGLLALHGFLALWAIIGFIERFSIATPWAPISNPHFPRGILLMQWTLTLAAASVFIAGYIVKWRHTPQALAFVYVAMAALCAIETFGYMQNDFRFVAMALEYLAYAGILLFLFRLNIFRTLNVR